jgi:hypothetical protein
MADDFHTRSIVSGHVTEDATPGAVLHQLPVITLTANAAQRLTSNIGTNPDGSPAWARRGVTIQADSANTGSVRVGNSTTTGSGFGLELQKGASITLPIDDPTAVWCFASVSGCKVNVLWV